MKNTLTVYKKDNLFYIRDISISLIKLFDLDSNYSNLENSELALPFLVNHIQVLDLGTLNYIEFFYKIENQLYKIQIVKNINNTYTVFFEDTDLDLKKDFIEDSCINNYSEFITNDKDLLDVINLKNKSPEAVYLELIYLLKKIKEEMVSLKTDNEDQERKFIDKDSFTLAYIVEKLGIKKIIIFLFIIALIESFVLEPLLNPFVHTIYKQIEESITEQK